MTRNATVHPRINSDMSNMVAVFLAPMFERLKLRGVHPLVAIYENTGAIRLAMMTDLSDDNITEQKGEALAKLAAFAEASGIAADKGFDTSVGPTMTLSSIDDLQKLVLASRDQYMSLCEASMQAMVDSLRAELPPAQKKGMSPT